MSLEFANLTINWSGSTLIFSEANGAGPAVPFMLSRIEDASAFLAEATDRTAGIDRAERELVAIKGAISLGLVSPTDAFKRRLTLLRQPKERSEGKI